jgi:hypothetical protein
MNFTTIFALVATIGAVAVPWVFLRDIRSRYPDLWTQIGSPTVMRESCVSFASKVIRGLHRLRSDASLTREQREFCSRYWRLLVLVYGLEAIAVCMVAASRLGPRA